MEFVIRDPHQAALDPAVEPAFERQVMQHVQTHHKTAMGALKDEELQQRVRFGLARGRRHGLTLQNTLTAYVVLMFEVGPNFDEHPAIGAVLGDTSHAPDDRISLLTKRVTDQQWVEANKRARPEMWPRG